MILNKEKYLIQKPVIEQWIKNKPSMPITDAVSEIALATGCPILVVCQFTGELFGFSPELTQLIENLKKFYNIDEIV